MRTFSAVAESAETNLQDIAERIVQRAQREGCVRAQDVREELERAGKSPRLWKDVLALAGPSLNLRRGRYYYTPAVSDRLRQQLDQRATVTRAAQEIIREVVSRQERRGEERIDFIQPVQVRTEDGRVFALLSRDLSTSGMRLIGTRSLLGQKLQVRLAATPEDQGWHFVLRILWTCSVGDDLFENGGVFVEARPDQV